MTERKQSKFPPGWDEERVRRVIEHYENQSEEEAVAEDEKSRNSGRTNMAEPRVVIGLEVHVQLSTKSKIFCGCRNEFGGEPNSHCCPICLGMPGVLPVLNEEVLRRSLALSLAIGARISPRCRFARKNYFYPDLPKGYQISQFDECLSYGGSLEIEVDGRTKRIGLDRIQIEEDAGKSLHSEDSHMDDSLVDMNRCGTPLLEIISLPQPDKPNTVADPSLYLNSPDEAVAYWTKLRTLTRWLGVSEANMEMGNMRCDANISIWDERRNRFGTKTEIKNLNSFRFLHRALTQEIARHRDILADGGTVLQETMLYDPAQDRVAPMRSKEEAHDYRYFPEPDLVPVVITPELLDEVRATIPELPEVRHARFLANGLTAEAAALLSSERPLADYYEAVVAAGADSRAAANWVIGDVLRELNARKIAVETFPVPPAELAGLVALVRDSVISTSAAREVFSAMVESGRLAKEIVAERGLAQISDTTAIRATVEQVIAGLPKEVARYRAGETKLFGFFVGQVMRATKGQANPKLLNDVVREVLGQE